MPYCEYPSPVGILTLVASDAGLQGVWWPDDARLTQTGELQPDHPVLAQAKTELDEYFAGRRTMFDVRLDPQGTEFQRAAWDVLRQAAALSRSSLIGRLVVDLIRSMTNRDVTLRRGASSIRRL